METLLCLLLLNSEFISLIQNSQIAALSTDYKGTPFGSLIPYTLDKHGNPVVFISKLALHTKNLSKNPKCSLMISRVNKNVFNSSRVTFVGKMIKIPDDELKDIRKNYLSKYNMANDFIDFEDFGFYRLEIDKIYWVGGFGDIEWIDVEEYHKHFDE